MTNKSSLVYAGVLSDSEILDFKMKWEAAQSRGVSLLVPFGSRQQLRNDPDDARADKAPTSEGHNE